MVGGEQLEGGDRRQSLIVIRALVISKSLNRAADIRAPAEGEGRGGELPKGSRSDMTLKSPLFSEAH